MPKLQVEQQGFKGITAASRYLGMGRYMVRRLMAEGKIRGQQVGGIWVFSRADLDRFLAGKAQKNAPTGARR